MVKAGLMSRFALLGGGVRVRVGVRDQRKIKRRSKEPLMAILDITQCTTRKDAHIHT